MTDLSTSHCSGSKQVYARSSHIRHGQLCEWTPTQQRPRTMLWRTHFASNQVEYNATPSIVKRSARDETWREARVFICEITPGVST